MIKTPRAATPTMRTGVPKLVQRLLPLVAIAGLVFFFFSGGSSFGSSSRYDSWKGVLDAHAPYESAAEFPKKIWQIWKVDVLDFEGRDHDRARSWPQMNPAHRYEVLTDGNDMTYVRNHFGPDGLSRPDIVDFYGNLTAKIIKADLLRYLVMYVEGGVYADIDVEAMKPIDEWVPNEYDPSIVDLVVSVEIDEPNFKNHKILGPKSQSFCQWTFMAKPRVPIMMQLVERIMKWLNDVADKQGKPISDVELDFDEVISGTGPSAFTNVIIAEMEAKTGRKIDWDYFHAIQEPRFVGGVLVMTVKAFAAGQGHSNSGFHNASEVLVRHHYHASGWPKTHPRYLHPVYREVELCNWKPDCVKAWDRNTTEFEKLSKSTQETLIAEATEKYEREEKERIEREEADRKREEEDRAREERERICNPKEEDHHDEENGEEHNDDEHNDEEHNEEEHRDDEGDK